VSALVPVVCRACGANIVRMLSEVRRNPATYCSKKCRGVMQTRIAATDFWRSTKRAPSGCLEWTGGRNTSGYGAACIGGKRRASSTVAWMLTRGAIPTGQCVCHKCDNRLCVEPSHLFLGSNTDNWNDMRAKGRHRGGRNHRQPLPPAPARSESEP
jgi:hypothetical protein